MGNWSDLKQAVAQVIRENGNQEITGQILQDVLNSIISNVGQNSTFVDIATPSTNPGTPDGNVFYIASQAGTYANFGGISLDGQDICILLYNGTTWTAKSTGAATKASIINAVEITALDFDLDTIGKIITANMPCRFAVTKNGKNVGLLDCYSDESNHMFTQEFTTHYLLPFTGDSTTHTDDIIYKYVRSYHITGGSSSITQGTWGEWKLVFSSDINTETVKLGEEDSSSVPVAPEVTADYANKSLKDWDGNDLRKAMYMSGVLEYEEFSTSKEYAVGDVVSYMNKAYKFIAPHSAGAWDESQVEETNLKEEINRLNNQIGLSNLFTISGYYDYLGNKQESDNWVTTGKIKTGLYEKNYISFRVDNKNNPIIGGWDYNGLYRILVDRNNNIVEDCYLIPNDIEYYQLSSAKNSILPYAFYKEVLDDGIENLSPTNYLSIKGYYNNKGVFTSSETWRTTGKLKKNYLSNVIIKYFIGSYNVDIPILSGWDYDGNFRILIEGKSVSVEKGTYAIPNDIQYYQISSAYKSTDFYVFLNENKSLPLLELNSFVNLLKNNGYYDSNGNLQESETWVTTGKLQIVDYIYVKLKYYSYGEVAYIGYWDENGIFTHENIDADYEGEYKFPSTAKFIEFSFPKESKSIVLFKRPSVSYEFAKRVVNCYIPKYCYAITGKDLRIYPYNLISVNSNDLSLDVMYHGINSNEEATFIDNPQQEQNMDFVIRNYDGELYKLGTTKLIVKTPINPSDKLYVLPIGDSVTYNFNGKGAWVNEFSRMLNGNGDEIANGASPLSISNVEVIGTYGTGTIKHEGRSGWTINNYLNNSAVTGINNPFYSESAGGFDLSYYLSKNGFINKGVKEDGSNLVVIIFLNWNSVFSQAKDGFINDYNTLLNKIHTSAPSARIMIIGLNAPCGKILKSNNAERYYSRASVMQKVIEFETYLDNIEEQNSEFVTHVPLLPFFCAKGSYPTTTKKVNLRIDEEETFNTDFVHPNEAGEGQIADIILNAFCCKYL